MNARELNGVLAGKIGSALDHFNDVVGDNPALCDWPGRDCNDQGSLAAARSELVEALAAYDALIADTRAGEGVEAAASEETVIATSDEMLTRLANLYGVRAYEGEPFAIKHVGWRFTLSELRDFVAQIEVEVGHD